MARYGFFQCGAGDPTDPRNYLPNGVVANPYDLDSYVEAFTEDASDMGGFGFLWCWRWKVLQIDLDVDWTDGVNSYSTGPLSGQSIVGWASSNSLYLPKDERGIGCQDTIEWAFSGGLSPDPTFIIQLRIGPYYDAEAKTFKFGTRGGIEIFGKPSPTVHFGDFPFAGSSLINCTMLGHTVPMFDQVGTSSGTINIDLPPTGAYWEYRDANQANPIFDLDTGKQLIDPIPTGF